MKNTGVCPKCGGQEIAVMRGKLDTGYGSRLRGRRDDPYVDRYLCCACGYLESWVDPDEFVRSGSKEYWEKWEGRTAAIEQEQAELDKRRVEREAAAQREREAEKRKNARRDDPWN